MRTFRSTRRTVIPFLVALALATGSILAFCDADAVQPRFPLTFEGMLDTDDMCIWIHPTDPSLSTIIAADKSARIIVVYDLSGDVLQTFSVLRTETALEQPGNIDLRYGFPLGDELIDIVAFNQRSGSTLRSIHVYMVDPETRLLSRIDDGNIATHRNYGMCLYKSPSTGKFYAFATSEKREGVEQYELFDNGDGQITGTRVRSWDQEKCEGAVADDELGYVYICEESSGAWRYDAEPDASTEGTHIAVVGENGFEPDAEGVTIYYAADGRGYIIVSSQGSNSFLVYNRQPPHEYIKTFSVEGARDTDGIDVTNVDLGPDFPYGIFVCHTRGDPAHALVSAYEDLGLTVDTTYDPRGRGDED